MIWGLFHPFALFFTIAVILQSCIIAGVGKLLCWGPVGSHDSWMCFEGQSQHESNLHDFQP